MKILVCGGRDFKDQEAVNAVLSEFDPEVSILIEGHASGADRLARVHALTRRWVAVWSFPADWETHGKGAGMVRNKAMLVHGQPHLVIAFPGGKGTANMVMQAKQAGVPVRIIE